MLLIRELARDAFDCGAQEILMQAWGETADEMLAVGRQLASLDPRINVKVPITKQGVEVLAFHHSRGEPGPFAVVQPTTRVSTTKTQPNWEGCVHLTASLMTLLLTESGRTGWD
jgi:hypothetical protein